MVDVYGVGLMTLHLENRQTSICLGRWTSDFTRMREWNRLFMNGCKCKMQVCISTGFWKPCKCGTIVSVCWGALLESS